MTSDRAGINPAAKPSGTGCVECLALGKWWLHLRRCAECGHIGCCDSSPNQHASKHYAATGHPIITSFEPGEHWFYDYRAEQFVTEASRSSLSSVGSAGTRTGRSSALELANAASRIGAAFLVRRRATRQISASQGRRLRIRSVGDTTTVRPRAKGQGHAMATNSNIRPALERHRAASDANDFDTEHQIYREDAVLEYPQSGERIRGRDRIQASRMAQPNYKRFSVRRIIGAANFWVTEFILTFDGPPSYTVSIMEFEDERVIRETQYFGDPFQPGPSRSQWVERM